MQRKTGISNYLVFKFYLLQLLTMWDSNKNVSLSRITNAAVSYKDTQWYSNTLPHVVNWIQEIPQCKIWGGGAQYFEGIKTLGWACCRGPGQEQPHDFQTGCRKHYYGDFTIINFNDRKISSGIRQNWSVPINYTRSFNQFPHDSKYL